ncbi:chromosome partitioning protein ParA [Vibrio diazotrophicus]|uniref:Chromosome partitioning protein ParA n=1 Tax=Vibrio diazotrophicus TaxID=685 RepID=A0A2J8I0X8_VIBDI|nr:chromosome partitioning protein ParA [Vibrio diazotrophicus]PNI04186.1 chromosome partitioning protein ParA [Vibrio diazotrophicus]
MNQTDLDDDHDDVVVIEQRDKRGVVYIAVAAVLGLALGGLIGSTVTASKWEKTYQVLEAQYQKSLETKTEEAAVAEQNKTSAQEEFDKQLAAAMDEQEQKHQQALANIESQLTELEKVNMSLEAQVAEQKAQLEQTAQQNAKLNRQSDMQTTMLERSRELFQQELKIKQEVETLQKERDELVPKLKTLKKECDVYLEGKSWDATSDSCDKQDAASSRISQIDQMLRIHQMDLEQIKALSEELGL